MPKNTKVPVIRFKGFIDAWEQRKVGEIIVERNIQTPKSDEYPLMAFIAYEGVTSKGDRYNRESLVTDRENKKYKQTELGDFIYSSNNLETGSIGLNNYGKASISPVYSIFQPTALADSDFIGRRLVRKDFINKMVKWRQGVIYGQWRIHEADFIKIDIAIPSVAEQQKIGAFFCNLDNLITLHQRKLLKLKNVKKAMLEKMFPKNGSNVPEIRFARFTEAWEQRKLNKLVQFSKGSGYSKENLKETGTPIILYGRLYTKYETVISNVDTFVELKPGSVLSRGGEVIVPASGETAEDISIASVVEKSGVILGGDLNVITPLKNIEPAFLAISISTGTPHRDMAKMAQGKSIVHLHNSDLEKIDLLYPTQDEQKMISSYFRHLDNLITLYQRKHEKLQNIKKACLDRMFV